MLLDKTITFANELEEVKKAVYPYFLSVEENNGPLVKMGNKKIIMMGSNNYLGLSTDPRVQQAAQDAISQYGTTNSGSRLMNGHLLLHEELEWRLAQFFEKEACLLFTTGFMSNQGTIVPLIGKEDYIYMDKDNHNSIVQGVLISKGIYYSKKVFRYKHNDMRHLEKLLKQAPRKAGKFIITDGVFSMGGDLASIKEIVSLAKTYQATIMVDDAHGVGVIGEKGQGISHFYGVQDHIDLITGTFSKSLASIGGFVVGAKHVIEYLKHHSPSFMFSASMPASALAATLQALTIIENEPERIVKLQENGQKIRKGLQQLGYDVPNGSTPIIPIYTKDDQKTFTLWKRLLEAGVYTNAVISPAVMPGHQMLRVNVMSTHDPQHINEALCSFEKVISYL
ncbi:aminotransferase class I/II-fold pyridoxal phosphate-dependent enzyme [Bacillus carboniphilus]|uniref:Aminotransferase class I/II-fold pyridoxal phosphate-dependent enzyme n=1 Tax=Bacillus carboniphilus TaxID=86663 RepID=A0ABY9K051_9BACI|nr:aminotransferase class I/II-fold pyridoxal phosphate-dependent enzyme [Bacillus carboniphilus]WLR43276.1 aminotransferase class I/II-fold pyridoxal phosphate-dependent enzyme [Bacillus carboniphilus]